MARRRRPERDREAASPALAVVTHPAAAPTLAPVASASSELRVDVVRSAKRRRTVGARLVGDVLTVTVPASMAATDVDHWVATMTARFARRRTTDRIDLGARAASLAHRHQLPSPRSIRWADDMHTRWGSCTPATGAVRISTRLAAFPDWVVDYVIVHELAHIEVADHSPCFWALVDRFPRTERARGYLIAKSGETDD